MATSRFKALAVGIQNIRIKAKVIKKNSEIKMNVQSTVATITRVPPIDKTA